VHAAEEGLDLLLDALAQPVLADLLDLLLLVGVRDCLSASVRDEVLHLRAAELVDFDREVQLDHALDAVVQHPLQVAELGLVHVLQVGDAHSLIQHLLLEGLRELHVHQHIVVQGLPDDAAHEFELREVLRVDPRVFIRLLGLTRGTRSEQRLVLVEHFTRQNLEPLAGQTPDVGALLLLELHIEFLAQFRL